MNPYTTDPHHQSPADALPQDEWSEDVDAWPDAGGTILPPRRLPLEYDVTPSQTAPGEGLRIEAGAPRSHEEETRGGLDLREIDGTVLRLAPELPTQPKVVRHVAFHPQPAGKKREIELVEWGRTKAHSVKWLFAVGFGAAAVVVFSLGIHPRLYRADSATATSPAMPADDYLLPKDGGAMEDLINRQPEAERLFSKFISKPAVADLLLLVRDRNAVEPLIRASSLKPPAGGAATLRDCRWEVRADHGPAFAMLAGSLPDFSDFLAYFVLTDGMLQIDWEATTGYGSASFEQLANGKGNPAEIRGTLSPAEYYSPVFPEAEYQSYLFEAPHAKNAVWCYTRRGDPPDDDLAALFRSGEILKSSQLACRVTLRLNRGPAQALPNQWFVDALLHEEWIHP